MASRAESARQPLDALPGAADQDHVEAAGPVSPLAGKIMARGAYRRARFAAVMLPAAPPKASDERARTSTNMVVSPLCAMRSISPILQR